MKALALLGLALILLLGCTTTVPCVNVTCNGVTTCRAPNDIPPCVPPVPNSTNTTCPVGYVCGIQADGCAVPGAIYNCPMEPANITIAVNLTQELNNSAEAGFAVDEGMFQANSSSECTKELISACDNNMPGQFICVNQRYAGNVSSQYDGRFAHSICPDFFLAGTVYCGLDGDDCVVLYQGPD